jgi:hypothetical protein
MATATGNGPFTYSWSTTGTNDTALVTLPNTYTVTATDMNGCSNMAMQAVTVNPLPVVTVSGDIIGGTTICHGMDTLMANATGSGPFMYMWNTGSTNDTAIVSSTNLYMVTVTDANGCSQTTNANVTVNTATISITGNGFIATGSADTLTANGGTNYMWSTGSTSDTTLIAPLSPTTYTVTGTDINGCIDTATFNVMVSPTGIANFAGADKTSLYPNPAVNVINLTFEMKGNDKAAVIKLIDASGKEVMSTNGIIGNGKIMPIDISNLSMGMYFVKVITDKNTQVVRFIKQ